MTAQTRESSRAPLAWDEWLGLGVVLTLLTFFTVPMPFPLTDSGTLDVFPGELLGVLLGAVLVVRFVARRYVPSPYAMRLLWVLVAFVAWYVVVTAVRFATGEEVKQSGLALRSSVVPLVCYFLMDAKLEKARRVVAGLVLLNLAVTVFHLPEWQDMRMSDYLGNSMVYAGLLVLLIPLNTYALVRPVAAGLFGRVLRISALANLFFALVMPVWTGSRSLTMLCFLVFFACLVMMVRDRRVLLSLGAVLVIAFAAHAVVWKTNPGGAAFGIYRVVPMPPMSAVDADEVHRKALDDVKKVTDREKNRADLSRGVLQQESLDEIREDPFFTDGRLYFPYENDLGEEEATAHNFVLEHINAYGVIGFGLYLALFVAALWPGWRRLRARAPGAAENIAAFGTVLTAMAFSLAQPTMLILSIVIPLWLVVGALKSLQVAEMGDERAEEMVHA